MPYLNLVVTLLFYRHRYGIPMILTYAIPKTDYYSLGTLQKVWHTYGSIPYNT